MSLEIDVSEDKRRSGWQYQEGEVQSGKEWSWEVFFLPEMALRSLKTARGSERGDRFEQVACQVADLALEMTEDALREAVYVSEAVRTQIGVLRSGPSVVPALQIPSSWDHQALGERPRWPKG